MSDRMTAIIREVRVQQQAFANHRPTANLQEIVNRQANEKAVVLVDRIAELEADIDQYREIDQQNCILIAELKATIEQVRECQRYTVHRDAYTTDNPTGKWMKADDVLAALDGDKDE